MGVLCRQRKTSLRYDCSACSLVNVASAYLRCSNMQSLLDDQTSALYLLLCYGLGRS